MCSDTDLSIIMNGYFTVIALHVDYCIIKSNNTKHSWKISQSSDGYYILLHKHQDYHKFHFRRGCMTIEACLVNVKPYA